MDSTLKVRIMKLLIKFAASMLMNFEEVLETIKCLHCIQDIAKETENDLVWSQGPCLWLR